ncbi:MAG: hypothetical protein ACE5G8_13320, partial [Anaerolineae bacterium]
MSAMTGLAAALKKRPRPLNLLWRFLATYEGLNWTWLAGVALSAALGVNLTVIGLPDERVAALALAALILSGGIIRAGVRIWLAAAAIPAVGAAYLLLGWANLWRSVQSIAGALAAVAGQLASGGGAMLPAAALQQSLVIDPARINRQF